MNPLAPYPRAGRWLSGLRSVAEGLSVEVHLIAPRGADFEMGLGGQPGESLDQISVRRGPLLTLGSHGDYVSVVVAPPLGLRRARVRRSRRRRAQLALPAGARRRRCAEGPGLAWLVDGLAAKYGIEPPGP